MTLSTPSLVDSRLRSPARGPLEREGLRPVLARHPCGVNAPSVSDYLSLHMLFTHCRCDDPTDVGPKCSGTFELRENLSSSVGISLHRVQSCRQQTCKPRTRLAELLLPSIISHSRCARWETANALVWSAKAGLNGHMTRRRGAQVACVGASVSRRHGNINVMHAGATSALITSSYFTAL